MITVQFKLIPTAEQEKLLRQTVLEYISSANDLLDYCGAQVGMPKLSSSSFIAPLPSAVKNEVVNAVKSIMRKHERGTCKTLPVLRNPVSTWNNQNYKLTGDNIEFPVWSDGRSKRIRVKAVIQCH